MTLRSLWSHLKGYVIIRISGKAIEGLINEAYNLGIELWELEWIDERSILIKIYLRDLPKLRNALKNSGCSGRVEKKVGLPFITMKLWKRKGFALGAILFFILLYVMSSFVWFVKIVGCNRIDPTGILKFATAQGIRAGVLKSKVEPENLGKLILAEFPDLSWVGVQLKGTIVNIEIVEKALPQIKPEVINLVAMEDAIVTNIIVLAGEPCVNEGDIVAKGDTLISAITYVADNHEGQNSGSNRVISAKGVVMGRVWRTYEKTFNLVKEIQVETGMMKKIGKLSFGSYELKIGPRNAPFQAYIKDESVFEFPGSKWNLPSLKLSITIFRETRKHTEVADREKILIDLKEEACENLRSKIPKGAKVLDEYEELKYPGKGRWVYTLTIETLEDIAGERGDNGPV